MELVTECELSGTRCFMTNLLSRLALNIQLFQLTRTIQLSRLTLNIQLSQLALSEKCALQAPNYVYKSFDAKGQKPCSTVAPTSIKNNTSSLNNLGSKCVTQVFFFICSYGLQFKTCNAAINRLSP